MKAVKKVLFIGLVNGLFVQMTGCAPINRFTRIKKIPGEYAVNYCAGEIKPRHTLLWFQKEPWIVFSDSEDNFTYRKPGGKVTLEELDFMEPLAVIGRKGEYLRVMKYSSETVESGKIKERKKAKYCGWIHKSKVLLTRQSVTDIRSGLKNKYLTIFTDTLMFDKAGYFFDKDSVFTFKGGDLTSKNKMIPFYDVVYRMKLSEDGKKSLLSSVAEISVDSASQKVLGWVDNSLLRSIGQQLHVDITTLPVEQLSQKNKDFLSLFDHTGLQYAPVLSYTEQDSIVNLKTGIPVPVIDEGDNYVFNVNGVPIYYNQFTKLKNNLRKINVVFVLEGKELAISQIPAFANVIQTLQSVFENRDDPFVYQFGLVLPFKEKGKSSSFPILGLENDYMKLIDTLAERINNIKKIVPSESGSWQGVRKAVDLFKGCETETNVIVVAGETGSGNEKIDSVLVRRLAERNCRLLGFQLYNGQSDNYNNFVLQLENMIDHSAGLIARNKRKMIVYTDQLRPYNEFTEHGKNAYGLDFPDRSMTQGWIVFPEKSQSLSFDGLETAVDTLLQEIKLDNNTIIGSLEKAFRQAGNYRNRFDSSLVRYFKMDTLRLPDKPFLMAFKEKIAASYVSLEAIPIDSIENSGVSYKLLLSKQELDELRSFMKLLSAREVDYKSNAGKRKKTNKICDCPPEEEEFIAINPVDSVNPPKYASTRQVRRHLMRLYLRRMKEDKYCIPKRKVLKTYSLAHSQREITTCPTENEFLTQFSVKDIKKRKIISDEMLDRLITYFKSQKDLLEGSLYGLPFFTSGGVEYYWLDEKYLP